MLPGAQRWSLLNTQYLVSVVMPRYDDHSGRHHHAGAIPDWITDRDNRATAEGCGEQHKNERGLHDLPPKGIQVC